MKREHASIFIEYLPDTLRQYIYRDADLCARASIVTISHMTFHGKFRLERNAFERAAQAAIDSGMTQQLLTDTGNSVRIRAIGGPRAHLVVADENHTVILRRFELLSHDRGKRTPVLRRMFRHYHLSQRDRQKWQRLCDTRPLTLDNFDDLTADLLDTPDGPRVALSRLKRRNEISLNDLVPSSLRYYERLIGRDFDPSGMTDAIQKVQRKHSLPVILALAATPSMSPMWILKSFSADEMLVSLRRAASLPDPYSLAAAFELAATASSDDPRAASIALTIATNLLSDKARLEHNCRLFSGLLIATFARVTLNPVLRDRGPAWRRAAAFTHAVLAHRALFTPRLDSEQFFSEIASMLGTAFYLAALLDKPQLPLWRPLWIQPTYIEADLVGRIGNAVRQMTSQPLKGQIEALVAAARSAIPSDVPPFAQMFPSFLEGYPAKARPTPPEVVQDILDAFASKPATEACVIAGNVAALAEPPDAVVPLYAAALNNLPIPDSEADWRAFLDRLSTASHAASVARSPQFAEAISDALFRALRSSKADPPTFEFITILQESAAAHPVSSDALNWLGEKFTHLASIAPAGKLLIELRNILDQQIYMRPSLAKAFAAARATIALAN